MSYKGGHPCRTGVRAKLTGAVNRLYEHVSQSALHLLITPNH